MKLIKLALLLAICTSSMALQAQVNEQDANKSSNPSNIEPPKQELYQPTILRTINKRDSLDLHILVLSGTIHIDHAGISVTTTSIDTLDQFIIQHNISNVSPNVYLEATKDTPSEMIVAICDVFTKNNISKFFLSSR